MLTFILMLQLLSGSTYNDHDAISSMEELHLVKVHLRVPVRFRIASQFIIKKSITFIDLYLAVDNGLTADKRRTILTFAQQAIFK
jgi:hypothetical protein